MLTLAYLGLGALTGQEATQHPSKIHDFLHATLTLSINNRLALPTEKQGPSVEVISSDEEPPPAKLRKTRSALLDTNGDYDSNEDEKLSGEEDNAILQAAKAERCRAGGVAL